MRFLCKVSSVENFSGFPATTALQRKLVVGALDFSPLHHSPALAERHYYTTKPPEWSGEILANITRGKSAAPISFCWVVVVGLSENC